jgi:hypothetical protein
MPLLGRPYEKIHKGLVTVRDSFKKKNVSQRWLGSRRTHGTTAGLKKYQFNTDIHYTGQINTHNTVLKVDLIFEANWEWRLHHTHGSRDSTVITTHSDHWKMVMTTACCTSHWLPTVKPNPFQYLPTKSAIPKLLFLVRKIEVNFFAPFRRVCAVPMYCLRHSQITVRCCELLRYSRVL